MKFKYNYFFFLFNAISILKLSMTQLTYVVYIMNLHKISGQF